MKKWINVSNIIYAISMVYALGVVAKIYYDRQNLPAGVCPVTNNNIWVYSAIAVLVIGIVVTTILDRKKKKRKEADKNQDKTT